MWLAKLSILPSVGRQMSWAVAYLDYLGWKPIVGDWSAGRRNNNHKITFKGTWSLSSMTMMSVHAHKCLNSTSATSISYMTWKVSPFDAASRLFWWFFTAHVQFRSYYNVRFKIWRQIWIQRTRFPIITLSFRARNTIFGDFLNVCAYTVSTLILLLVVNISPKMSSAASISYMT